MKKTILAILLAAVMAYPSSLAFSAGATFSRAHTFSEGETLTAANLNGEIDNIINNLDPTGVGGASDDVADMRSTTDPYPASTESLATDLLGELKRLRYVIQQITGKTYWYQDPDTTIATLNTGQNPAGTMLPYAGATAPTGYLLCYGQAVSQVTYAALYAVIGHTYGADPGGGNFVLPDMRGRFPLGKDNMGGSSANRVTAAAADTVGSSGGTEQKDLSHTHTYNTVIAHTHNVTAAGNTANNTPTYISGGSTSVTSADFATSSTGSESGTTASGGSATTDIMPPFITLQYIIKY